MRALGDELQKRLGQPIVVENRSGGGMNIAGRACSEAPNDGYNICILPNEVLTLNEFTFKSIPYNPEKDFDPITNAFINTQVLVVSSALGVNSLESLPRCPSRSPARCPTACSPFRCRSPSRTGRRRPAPTSSWCRRAAAATW